MNRNKWLSDGQNYEYEDIPTVTDKLPVGVYELSVSMKGFYLRKVSEKFELPAKVYDSERTLIERVKKSFNGFNKNFGILLKGLKGTGKTITGKQICNELTLPVILVNTHYNNMGTFINSINQDVVLFFDEFEKTYEFSSYNMNDDDDGGNPNDGKKGVGALLTLMDGVFTSSYKRLFILTTNREYMPDAIISRPSRVRYIKDFTDISYEGIMEILNDVVKNKELIPGLLELMKDLKIISVDIVKAIAEEANLYNTCDRAFFSIFNLSREESYNDIFEVDNKGNEKLVVEATKLDPNKLYESQTINVAGAYVTIKTLNFETSQFTGQRNKTVTDKEGKKVSKLVTINYVFKKHQMIHKSLEVAF